MDKKVFRNRLLIVFLLVYLAGISIIVGIQTVNDDVSCADDETKVFLLTTQSEDYEVYGAHIKDMDDGSLSGDRAVCLDDSFFEGADVRRFDDQGAREEYTRIVESYFHVDYYQDTDEGCHERTRNVLSISEDYRNYEDGAYGSHAGTPGDYDTDRSVCMGFVPEAVEDIDKTPFEVSEVLRYNTTTEEAAHYDLRTGEEDFLSSSEFEEDCLNYGDCFRIISFTDDRHMDEYSTANSHLFGDSNENSELDIYINITDHSHYPRVSCETGGCISEDTVVAGDSVVFTMEIGPDIYPRMNGPNYDENGFEADFSDDSVLYPLRDVRFCKDNQCNNEMYSMSGLESGDTIEYAYSSSEQYEEVDLYVQAIDIVGNSNIEYIGSVEFLQPPNTGCESDDECMGICDDGVCTTEIERPEIEFLE